MNFVKMYFSLILLKVLLKHNRDKQLPISSSYRFKYARLLSCPASVLEFGIWQLILCSGELRSGLNVNACACVDPSGLSLVLQTALNTDPPACKADVC